MNDRQRIVDELRHAMEIQFRNKLMKDPVYPFLHSLFLQFENIIWPIESICFLALVQLNIHSPSTHGIGLILS